MTIHLALATLAVLVIVAAFSAAFRYSRIPDRQVQRATVGGFAAFAAALVLAITAERAKHPAEPHLVVAPAPDSPPPAPDAGKDDELHPSHSRMMIAEPDETLRGEAWDREDPI